MLASEMDYLNGLIAIILREKRAHVGGTFSSWARITSGAPQGSALEPLLYFIYVNDLPDEIKKQLDMFVDDAKIMSEMRGNKECNILQRERDKTASCLING